MSVINAPTPTVNNVSLHYARGRDHVAVNRNDLDSTLLGNTRTLKWDGTQAYVYTHVCTCRERDLYAGTISVVNRQRARGRSPCRSQRVCVAPKNTCIPSSSFSSLCIFITKMSVNIIWQRASSKSSACRKMPRRRDTGNTWRLHLSERWSSSRPERQRQKIYRMICYRACTSAISL